MNQRELDLVPYYDRTLDYYSPISQEFMGQFAIDWPNTDSLLDLGCGDGRLLDCADTPIEYLGLDGSPGRIADAQKRWPDYQFMVADLYDPMPGPKAGIWSLICLFEVLEHLENPHAVLRLAYGACAPGGRIIGSVPIDSPGERHLQVFRSGQEAAAALEAKFVCDFVSKQRHVLLEWT